MPRPMMTSAEQPASDGLHTKEMDARKTANETMIGVDDMQRLTCCVLLAILAGVSLLSVCLLFLKTSGDAVVSWTELWLFFHHHQP